MGHNILDEAFTVSRKALESVGLKGFEEKIPYHLSTGEMRRVAIASVLSMSPEILIIDEPSAGLDPRAKRELNSLIQELSCTKLITSHDLEFVRTCTDRVIFLQNGTIVADGPTQQILNNRELCVAHGL